MARELREQRVRVIAYAPAGIHIHTDDRKPFRSQTRRPRRPCNIRHSPKPVGTREYFDEVEARKYFVEPHIPVFAEFPPLAW